MGAEAGQNGVASEQVVHKGQHLRVHYWRLEHRIFEQKVRDELELPVIGLVLDVEGDAFALRRNLDDPLAQRLGLFGRERVRNDREAERFQLGQVRLQAAL